MSLHTSGGPKVCVQLCTGAYRCVQVRTVAYSCVQLRTGCTQLYATVRSSQRFTKRTDGGTSSWLVKEIRTWLYTCAWVSETEYFLAF